MLSNFQALNRIADEKFKYYSRLSSTCTVLNLSRICSIIKIIKHEIKWQIAEPNIRASSTSIHDDFNMPTKTSTQQETV